MWRVTTGNQYLAGSIPIVGFAQRKWFVCCLICVSMWRATISDQQGSSARNLIEVESVELIKGLRGGWCFLTNDQKAEKGKHYTAPGCLCLWHVQHGYILQPGVTCDMHNMCHQSIVYPTMFSCTDCAIDMEKGTFRRLGWFSLKILITLQLSLTHPSLSNGINEQSK